VHTTNLRKVGGSTMLAVPRHPRFAASSGRATVDLDVEEGRLIVRPQTKTRYTLDELLAQCDPVARLRTKIGVDRYARCRA